MDYIDHVIFMAKSGFSAPLCSIQHVIASASETENLGRKIEVNEIWFTLQQLTLYVRERMIRKRRL